MDGNDAGKKRSALWLCSFGFSGSHPLEDISPTFIHCFFWSDELVAILTRSVITAKARRVG
jgi:hypothetical protein